MIDTSFENNIRYIRPYLGILLIGSMALGIAFMLYKAAQDLSGTLYAAVPYDIEEEKDTLHLSSTDVVRYGDTVSYTSSLSKKDGDQNNQYINTTCFQGDDMVFEKSTEVDVSVYLYDDSLRDIEWDGKDAECHALLVERVFTANEVSLRTIDSLSFEVKARGY